MSEQRFVNEADRSKFNRLAYRTDEVPLVFPIGRTMLFKLMREGKIRTVKIGRARLIPHESLVEFLDGQQSTPAA